MRSMSQTCIKSDKFVGSKKNQLDIRIENYKPLMLKGSISPVSNYAKPIPIEMMRNT